MTQFKRFAWILFAIGLGSAHAQTLGGRSTTGTSPLTNPGSSVGAGTAGVNSSQPGALTGTPPGGQPLPGGQAVGTQPGLQLPPISQPGFTQPGVVQQPGQQPGTMGGTTSGSNQITLPGVSSTATPGPNPGSTATNPGQNPGTLGIAPAPVPVPFGTENPGNGTTLAP